MNPKFAETYPYVVSPYSYQPHYESLVEYPGTQNYTQTQYGKMHNLTTRAEARYCKARSRRNIINSKFMELMNRIDILKISMIIKNSDQWKRIEEQAKIIDKLGNTLKRVIAENEANKQLIFNLSNQLQNITSLLNEEEQKNVRIVSRDFPRIKETLEELKEMKESALSTALLCIDEMANCKSKYTKSVISVLKNKKKVIETALIKVNPKFLRTSLENLSFGDLLELLINECSKLAIKNDESTATIKELQDRLNTSSLESLLSNDKKQDELEKEIKKKDEAIADLNAENEMLFKNISDFNNSISQLYSLIDEEDPTTIKPLDKIELILKSVKNLIAREHALKIKVEEEAANKETVRVEIAKLRDSITMLEDMADKNTLLQNKMEILNKEKEDLAAERNKCKQEIEESIYILVDILKIINVVPIKAQSLLVSSSQLKDEVIKLIKS